MAIGVLGAVLAAGPLGAAAARPNIILIVADDLGYGDVGFQGSKQIPTPNLDRLAASGVVCAQGYVSSAVCSPSRAGMLTGRNQVGFGYDNNLDDTASPPGFDPNFAGLPVTEKTIADRLHAAGYVTGLIGKWHLGSRPQFHPRRRGFDEFWGFLGGGHHYFPGAPAGRRETDIECSFATPDPITYLTDNITDQSIAFIQRHREKPFFSTPPSMRPTRRSRRRRRTWRVLRSSRIRSAALIAPWWRGSTRRSGGCWRPYGPRG
jgi:arylsulfatase A-like enzyme